MKLTFVDTGGLIAGARGGSEQGALNKREAEMAFYQAGPQPARPREQSLRLRRERA